MRQDSKKKIGSFCFPLKKIFLLLFPLITGIGGFAQCPSNIDFEAGDFRGWNCWEGHTIDNGGSNLIIWDPPGLPVPPNPNRHQMLTATPRPVLDPFGLFPVNCPNGSGHSIKLGNATGGNEAEGVSYTFTIPAGRNQYSLIYNYAVVFQDPGHPSYQQPRLQIEIKNLTDNTLIPCSNFDFVADNSLPGFFLAPVNPTNTPIWCKNWSANSIKLDGLAGKTIQLFFKTADCIFVQHFGYAYIDVNTECSSSFIGSVFCPDDTAINVTAPFGYETYKWWNIVDPTTILATTQTISFNPPPAAGTILQVALSPFAGYGCRDTLTAELLDTLTIQSQAGPDRVSCQNAPVQLGAIPKPTYVYSWSPVTGLSNPDIANPVATPSVTTEYVLTTSHDGGGCVSTDTVIVYASVLDTALEITGPLSFCSGDTIALLKVAAADSIQWYLDGVAIPGANQTTWQVLQTGDYHATVFSFVGCSLSTSVVNFVVNPSPKAGFATNAQIQCLTGNQFVFTDTSSITFGTMLYNWDFGDGNSSTVSNVNHSYAAPGIYNVKLLVTSDKGCTDSAAFTVTVYDSPVAAFDSDIKEHCLTGNNFTFTNSSTLGTGTMSYSWNLGDGTIATTRDVTHSYATAGVFPVTLTVTTEKGCTSDSSFNITVNPQPVVGFSEPNAQQCFGNNQFNFINSSTLPAGTMQYLWSFGDGTTATTRDATHSYTVPGNYTVKLVVESGKGCADSTTQTVTVLKYAFADFDVEPACIDMPLPLFNRTINTSNSVLQYLWDFGNGYSTPVQTPVYSYPAPGIYKLKLSVSTVQCPQTVHVKEVNLVIDAPVSGIRYPDESAVTNFPEQLDARPIGNSVLWTPPTSLDYPTSYRPKFSGLVPQQYLIQLKTVTGCVTVDTQYVKVRKKIEIYVPTTFTPDGNGLNDYLRPVLMGFVKVNYFRIFNRWGKLLFQMQSDRPGWNGKVDGKAQDLQTVVWMIEAVDVDGVTHKRQGTTILYR